jgi:hypothetical protein
MLGSAAEASCYPLAWLGRAATHCQLCMRSSWRCGQSSLHAIAAHRSQAPGSRSLLHDCASTLNKGLERAQGASVRQHASKCTQAELLLLHVRCVETNSSSGPRLWPSCCAPFAACCQLHAAKHHVLAHDIHCAAQPQQCGGTTACLPKRPMPVTAPVLRLPCFAPWLLQSSQTPPRCRVGRLTMFELATALQHVRSSHPSQRPSLGASMSHCKRCKHPAVSVAD